MQMLLRPYLSLLLIYPKMDNSLSLQEMNAMVHEVNETEVAPEDRLSEHVHEYDANSKKLFIAGTEAPKIEQEQKRAACGR